MAEKPKSSSGHKSSKSSSGSSSRGTTPRRQNEKMMEAIIMVVLAILVIQGFIAAFNNNGFLGRLTAPFTGATSLEDVDTPVGDDVLLSRVTEVFSYPGGPSLGTQPVRARGIVAGGPEYFNGERYWYVDFESGPDGWVPESALKSGSGRMFDPGDTPVGSSVRTKENSDVLSSPGGPSLGIQEAGARGVVTKGPMYANGERYWYVDFESGPDGWVAEKSLLNGNGNPFNPGTTPVGKQVEVTAGFADVRESAGGLRIGSQPRGAKGIITQGPMYANGERYWYVDFESGPDGWVAEGDIELTRKETALTKAISAIVGFFKMLSTLLSLLFLTGIIYATIRLNQVNAEKHKQEKKKENPVYAITAAQEHVNRRWERSIAHVQSENPADWRLAILEADIMLAELLDRMGYIGENVGEKLKRIEASDFNTIDDAWEAHKVRNLIAHQGSDFVLSKREAQRVIGLYANVFREFRYI